MSEPTATTWVHRQPKSVEVSRPNALPFVSIIIPCYNEERFIGDVIAALVPQYDKDRFEIWVVDGGSTDKTLAAVQSSAERFPSVRIQVLHNPKRIIPVALNIGINASQGDIIVRIDAHSRPSSNYVRRCVELLEDEQISMVGMPWVIRASTNSAVAKAIAIAVVHPFGIGDAKYRLASSAEAEIVDTVPFGVFRKKLWQEVGGFDESLEVNEDYEFNYRVRQRGGVIVLDRQEHSVYFPRSTFAALARQYFRYGLWKARMVKAHPRSIRMRQIAAPAFVATLIILPLLAAWWPAAAWVLLVLGVAYWVLALSSAVQVTLSKSNLKVSPLVAVCFPLIHICWGTGFWLGLLSAKRKSPLSPRSQNA